MENTFVFIDAGFLSKLSRHLGEGKYLTYDLLKLSNYLASQNKLSCLKSFYYTAPPFISSNPSLENKKRKEAYDKFINNFSKMENFEIREGRCQRLKVDGKFVYKQKGVDSLMVMDILRVLFDFPHIKNIILIASDSDFVPVINELKSRKVKTILYTYYERGRLGKFSTNNELIKSVSKYIKLSKQDFLNCPLNPKV